MARTVVLSINAANDASTSPSLLQVGPVTLNTAVSEGSVLGRDLCLSKGEFTLLHLLASRRNIVMSKEAVADCLGLDAPRLVDVLVWGLRTKLAKLGLVGLVSTVWGRGYAVFGEAEPDGFLPTVTDPAPAAMFERV